MPYINYKNKPSFLDKQNPDTPPGNVDKNLSPDQPPKKEESLFSKGGRRYDIERKLNSPDLRMQLGRELKKLPYSPEVNEAIKEEKAKMQKFGTYVDPEEIESLRLRAGQSRYWEEKHELQEMAKGGITQQESKQMAQNKIKRNFFERFFGLNDKK